jgi:hypothetical protein
MATAGLTRTIQEDWSGGMFRNGAQELIPTNGCYDITNGLLDLLGGVFKRGGSSYRSTAAFGELLTWIWDGWLTHGGHTTLIASLTAFGRIEGSGAVTNLGHSGLQNAARPAVMEGVLYFPEGATFDGETWGTAKKVGPYVAIVANRLVVAEGNKIFFSAIGKPTEFAATDFHQLPGGVQIIGMQGSRETAVIFTTGGIWVIGGMALNLTDEKGNVQQKLDHYSGDLVLWGDAGIAAWEGSLVVPTTDGVWLIKRGATSELIASFQRISNSIRDLYRQYVEAGYQPGLATVFANHYLLPIIGGGKVIDLLVCRLDMPAKRGAEAGAWTHFLGPGAQVGALTTRVSAGVAREPELIGALYNSLARVLNLSYFKPGIGTELDAEGAVPQWSLQTRGYTTGAMVPNLVSRIRARYQMWQESGSPTIRCDIAGGAPPASGSIWGRFIWGIGTWATPGEGGYEMLSGEAPADLEGVHPFVWNVRKKRRFVSFRLLCPSATAQLSLRALELFVRPQGRI